MTSHRSKSWAPRALALAAVIGAASTGHGCAAFNNFVAAIERRMTADTRIAESLRQVKIGSVVDLLGTYGASGKDMRAWLADAPINRDFSVKLEYISGLALNDREADPIYSHMVAGRAYPSDLFVAPPALDAELRRRLITEATH